MMSGQWREVVRLCFKGERFRDHALDLTALNELRQFQKMVTETAEALWRKANPDRDRLPRHFEDHTRLFLRKIEEGSAAVPLEVFIEEPERQELMWPQPDEIDEAIDLAYRVFGAAHEDTSLPNEFPKELLNEYVSWGQGLSDEEVLEFAPPGKVATQVTKCERERLNAFSELPYEDEVDVTGHVLEADVRQKRFQIWLDDRMNVHVPFTEEQETKVTTALKEHNLVRLRIQGRGEFDPAGALRRIISLDSLDLVQDEEITFDTTVPSIEDVITDIFKDVSDEEWNRLPRDLTDRLDYHLYGGGENEDGIR